jgi:hypothetical protein
VAAAVGASLLAWAIAPLALAARAMNRADL